MKFAHGTFNGTGAALYFGIGFLPDWVYVQNLEDADLAQYFWNIHMERVLETAHGYRHYTAAGSLLDPLIVGDLGIVPYEGGTPITATSTTYLRKYDADYRTSVTYGTISAWTLGSAANRTGNWDIEADTTYVGEGSRIMIRESMGGAVKWAGVNTVSSNGEQANEVVLSRAIKSGTILKLTGMYDYRGASAGDIMPAGFGLLATDVVNVSGEMGMFEAGTYDN
jgi:hypothetical protein